MEYYARKNPSQAHTWFEWHWEMAKTEINGPIKTVVVLVRENRSFDHMLGWMKNLNPEIDGVTGQEWNPISTTDPNSAKVFFQDKSEYVDPDPGHSLQGITEQVFGNSTDTSANPPPMNGFAQQAESIQKGMSETVMNGFRSEALPVYKTLVSEFAVFDRWFASVPASTQPNRLFVHSATSHGATSNDSLKLIEGYPQKTIFESIYESGLSFGIYYQYLPSTLFYRNLRRLKYITKFHQYDLEFKNHAKQGKLPNYVVVEQRYFDLKILPANDDHPCHDVAEGQKFVKEVYEVLRSSPQWNQTLLILTYDEHGGFYDHVPTPVTDVPSPDGIVGPDPFFFTFDRLGIRVPTIMVSPWINKGTVVHEPHGPYPSSQFEHSSIAATVKKIFNLQSGFLTKRDAWAGTFESILQSRSSPRTDCPETMPTLPRLRQTEAKEDAVLNDFQQELVVLASQLNGEPDPDETAKKMNVKEAVEYVEKAIKRFLKACESAIRSGADDSEIVKPYPEGGEASTSASASTSAPPPSKIRLFCYNMLSCLLCRTD
eukprot:Gb_28054 [translate_table: standard]